MVSYNILAAAFATRRLGGSGLGVGVLSGRCRSMPDVPQQYLNWNYRKKLIAQQILASEADVVCLQELDRR